MPGSARIRYAVLIGGVAAPMAVFALLAALVASRPPGSWDRAVFAHLYSGESDWPLGPTPGRENPFVEVVMPQLLRLTDDRELIVLIAVVLVGAVVAGRRRAAVFFAVAVAIGVYAPLIKTAFERGSPFPLPGSNSFPSGHGIASMAVAAGAVVLLAGTKWFVPGVVVAALVVLGLGAAVISDSGHWLSDVVAGWCLAIAWVSTLWLVTSLRAGDRTVGTYLRERTRPAVREITARRR